MSDEAGERARSLLERAHAEKLAECPSAMRTLIHQHFPKANVLLCNCFGELFTEEERKSFFLKALDWYVRHPHQYDGRNLGTLLAVAAKRNAAGELTRRANRLPIDSSAAVENVAALDPALKRFENTEFLQTLCNSLSETEKTILMAPKDDVDWAAQLALKLNVKPNTISQKWARIREKLQAQLSEQGGVPC